MRTDTLLMEVLPRWNRFIGRSFKCGLPEGISPPIHFVITHLQTPATMTDLARMLRMSKQQMTKIADKVIEMGYAVRESDSNDRRIVRLHETEKARAYALESKQRAMGYFRDMFEKMDPEDEAMFTQALEMMNEVFIRMEHNEEVNRKEFD